MTKNTGDKTQSLLAEALKTFCRHNPAFAHRFYDTKSARGAFIPGQAGDFFLLHPGQCLLLECKSTNIGESLITLAFHGPVGRKQIASHRLWHRAGHDSYYLYHDIRTGRMEWHNGKNVVKKIADPVWSGEASGLATSINLLTTIKGINND